MTAWWKKEKKGMPIAVATPVEVEAAPVPTSPRAAVPQPSAPISPQANTGNYYVAAPMGLPHQTNGLNQQMGHPQQMVGMHPQPFPVVEGPVQSAFMHMQYMGNRSPAHKMFVMVNTIAALSAVNNAIAQIIALRYPGNYHTEVLLRLYMIGFCVLAVLLEVEFNVPILRESLVLTNWVSRGIFYTFMGLLGQSLYDVGYDNHFRRYNYAGSNNYGNNGNGRYYGVYGPRMPRSEDFAEWYVWLTSYLMFFVGALYIVLGALCLQNRLREIRREYQQSGRR